MQPHHPHYWRLATICLTLALVALVITATVRERALHRDHEIERREWETQKRTWSGRHDEQHEMIERLFDSQDEWWRELRQLKEENAELKRKLDAASTRPASTYNSQR